MIMQTYLRTEFRLAKQLHRLNGRPYNNPYYICRTKKSYIRLRRYFTTHNNDIKVVKGYYLNCVRLFSMQFYTN